MRRSLAPIALLLAALAAVAGLQYLGRSPRTGYAAPDFTLPDLRGDRHRLSDYRGRVVFLNLWATWCPPCRMEMPSMQSLYEKFEDDGLVMIAVAEEDDANAVRSFVNDIGIKFPVLIDPGATLSPRYGATGYPETFIIDRNGQVVNHTIGPADWNSPELVAYFEKLLATPAS